MGRGSDMARTEAKRMMPNAPKYKTLLEETQAALRQTRERVALLNNLLADERDNNRRLTNRLDFAMEAGCAVTRDLRTLQERVAKHEAETMACYSVAS